MLGMALKVMVVDDVASVRNLLHMLLVQMGYCVVTAEDGEQAVSLFLAESPDVVFMDVVMPRMDGLEATRRIKGLAGDRWVPVIMVSASSETDKIVEGFEAGADEYLPKPINMKILQAKMRSIERTVSLQTRVSESIVVLQEHSNRLQQYRDAAETENALAKSILARQLHRAGIDSPCVCRGMDAAADFSGDIAIAARSSDGSIYALMADATGHGLAAAISVLPIIPVFYAMARRNLSLSLMVVEMNGVLRGILPSGRFVAAAIARIDGRTPILEVWNGGMPDAIWLGGPAPVLFPSTHLPLGIVDSDSLEVTPTRHAWSVPGQLCLCSDGVVEAEDSNGNPFGLEGVVEVLKNTPSASRYAALRLALRAHLGECTAHDDASIMLVGCDMASGCGSSLAA